jgi:hypothetical protein
MNDSITLIAGKATQEFSIEHAERLLRMPNNGGWKIPTKSKYKFDINKGISIIQKKSK